MKLNATVKIDVILSRHLCDSIINVDIIVVATLNTRYSFMLNNYSNRLIFAIIGMRLLFVACFASLVPFDSFYVLLNFI